MTTVADRAQRSGSLLPGLALTALVVAVAYASSQMVSTLSALTIATGAGVILRNTRLIGTSAEPGLAFATRRLLRLGVVLLGLQLSVPDLVALGPNSIAIIVATVVVTFVATRKLGRRLGVSDDRSLLLASGFSICGASAVAAMGSVTGSDDDDTASAVAMVTIYGTIALITYPLLQGPLGLDDDQVGVWIGSSVHEVAQVVAAAAVAGEAALVIAVVAKLGRVVLLAPIIFAVGTARQRDSVDRRPWRVVPLFVAGFIVMAGIRSLDVIPVPALDASKMATTLLLAAAMFGLGAGVNVKKLIRSSPRTLLVGAGATIIAATTAYLGVLLLQSP